MSDYQPVLNSFLTDARALLDHVQATIEGLNIRVRTTTEVDMVLGAHFTRILLSTRTTLDLCEAGNLFDGATVARAVLEHFISFAYLVDDPDVPKACALFVQNGYSQLAQQHEAMVKHFPDLVDPNPRQAQIAKDIAEKAFFKLGMNPQLAALEKRYPNGIFAFLKDLPYSDYSTFSHPRAYALDLLRPEPAAEYRTDWPKYLTDCGGVATMVTIAAVAAAQLLLWNWTFDKEDTMTERVEALYHAHPRILRPGIVPGKMPTIK